MKYDSFKSLIYWLNEKGLEIDKETLNKVLSLDSFSSTVKDILMIIINDKTLNNKEKWTNMLASVGNDSLLCSSLLDILRIPYIRENDPYVATIMSEEKFGKRQNLIRALTNLKVYGDYNLYSFIRAQNDEQIQRRIVAVLEFELGRKMFNEIPLNRTSFSDFYRKLIGIEQAIIEFEKKRLEEITKSFIENPTKEKMDSLAIHQKYLDRVLTHYHTTELSMDLPEVTGEGPRALIFESILEEPCDDCNSKGMCDMLEITEQNCLTLKKYKQVKGDKLI